MLERSAGRAQVRGGMAAAAAFLQRAAELTAEPRLRSERALAAAQTSTQAGVLNTATELLSMAMAGPLDELQQARVELVRGQIAFASVGGSDAPPLLLKAAKQLEPLDAALARETYLDAWYATLFAGQFAGAGDLHEVSRAARSAPPPTGVPRPSDLLLEGLAVLVTEGRTQAAPLLRQSARIFAEEEILMAERLRWSSLAGMAAVTVWDEERWDVIQDRALQSCREAGLLVQVLLWVNSMALLTIWRGDFAAAASLIAEAEAIAAATGTLFAPLAAVLFAGFRGAEAEGPPLIKAVSTAARAAGQGMGVQWSQWAAAILYNGLGRYETALAEAQAAGDAPELFISIWVLPELIEAASRTGQRRLAADARAQLRTAHDMFATIGMQAFAERTRRELLATGETVRRRTADTSDQLTPQEAQIARLARAGMSNPEIAAQLFVSPRTVEYHLAKVFTKLDITSRRQLWQALPDGTPLSTAT
jgi:DNA-binding CsgD family transcriptional regulator